jgi:type I restriction enzyme M protein
LDLRHPIGLAGLIERHKPTDISLTVPVDDLAANDFNLSVERYVLEPEARRMRELTARASTVSLEDIAELYRPQAISGAKGAIAASETGLVEVGVADIDEAGLVRSPVKQLAVTPDVALQARRARLEAGDVLLVIKGSVGKVGFIREIPQGATWLASQSFVILRLRQHSPLSDPRVLFRFLTSGLGQANIQSLRVGAYVPGLQMADVRRLAIIVPDRKTQEMIARDVDGLFSLQDQIQELRAELADKQGRIWPGGFEAPTQETADAARTPRKPPTPRKKAS